MFFLPQSTRLSQSGKDADARGLTLISPQFGNYEGIPPLYICVGTHEIHYDDCINVANVAKQYGVNVTLRKWDNMIHAFPLLTPLFPEAKKAFGEICEFIKQDTSNNR
jgi:acetyl esterase/lipase